MVFSIAFKFLIWITTRRGSPSFMLTIWPSSRRSSRQNSRSGCGARIPIGEDVKDEGLTELERSSRRITVHLFSCSQSPFNASPYRYDICRLNKLDIMNQNDFDAKIARYRENLPSRSSTCPHQCCHYGPSAPELPLVLLLAFSKQSKEVDVINNIHVR